MSSNSIFPNQSKTVADRENDKEGETLRQLKSKYQRKLSEYSRLEKLTTEGTRGIVNSLAGTNQYAGKNIQLSNGPTGYVTQQGVFKPYPSGSAANEIKGVNGCPDTVSSVTMEGEFNPSIGSVLPTNPSLIVGSTMKVGQVCGNWDRNVQVVQNDDRSARFETIQTYSPASDNPLVYQSDISVDNTFAYSACKQRAIDLGANSFGVGYFNGRENGVKCAVGSLPITNDMTSSSTEVSGFEHENHSTVARFGLGNNSTGLTTFGEGDNKLWEPVSKKECVANSNGSLINQVEATFGGNCNGKTNMVEQSASALLKVGSQLASNSDQQGKGCVMQ